MPVPLAAQDDGIANVEGKARRLRATAAPEEDAKCEKDEHPTPIRRRPAAATTTTATTTTTALTRTVRLALAAVLVGSLRSLLTDRRQIALGRSTLRSSYSNGIDSIFSPLEDATSGHEDGARGGVRPSVNKDHEADMNAINSQSSTSNVVTSAAEEEEDEGVNAVAAPADDSSSSMCSCLNSFANRTCCVRSVLRAHKFGHVLAAEWFADLEASGDLDLPRFIDPEYFPDGADYRHVVMVRNFTEAFVSGYLYHKSGRECWLDPEGRPNGKPPHRQFNRIWVPQVRVAQEQHPRFGSFPPKGDRLSMCQYLADESERDGMKVYVAVALLRWYDGLKAYLRRTKKKTVVGSHGTSKSQSRSFFVCLEDASDPRYEKAWYDAAMDHLYPGSTLDGGGRYQHPFPQRPVSGGAKKKSISNASVAGYHGGHATSHDPDLRQRLTQLVMDLDRDVFDRRISTIDRLIGCAGSSGGAASAKAPP